MHARHLALCLTLLLAMSSYAFAGISAEPFAGYAAGEWRQSATSAKFSGADYGLRLGWDFGNVCFGGSFLTGTMTDSASPILNKIVPQDIGAFISFEISPVTVRGGYGFASQGTFTPSSGSANTWKGTSVNAGLGFIVVDHVSLNIDYVAATYDTLNGSSAASKMTNNTFVFGVSFPFEFGGK